jgi:Mg-chelatase subunit ChlD
MRGILGGVRKKLAESIKSLQPDQYFYIIFFGGDRLLEFGDGRPVRATERAKSTAYDFIDSVRPAGQTNAMAALERAVQIRDDSGFSPSVIYFLTDGFELTTEDAQEFSQKVASLLKRFAPATRINTIGFWPQSDDRRMLETIARQSGGEFVFVRD